MCHPRNRICPRWQDSRDYVVSVNLSFLFVRLSTDLDCLGRTTQPKHSSTATREPDSTWRIPPTVLNISNVMGLALSPAMQPRLRPSTAPFSQQQSIQDQIPVAIRSVYQVHHWPHRGNSWSCRNPQGLIGLAKRYYSAQPVIQSSEPAYRTLL